MMGGEHNISHFMTLIKTATENVECIFIEKHVDILKGTVSAALVALLINGCSSCGCLCTCFQLLCVLDLIYNKKLA
jgi:hypothetical protein